MLVKLPDGPSEVNTLHITGPELANAAYRVYEIGSGVVREGRLQGFPFLELAPTTELSAIMRPGSSPAPLFVVAHGNESRALLVQLRNGPEDILFLWAAEQPGKPGYLAPEDVEDCLSDCIRAAEDNRRFLNNHQYYYRKFWPGDELEHKLTLPPEVDIYGLAVEFRNLIGTAGFSEYVWEYGDVFQQWDFDNHLYEVPGPPAEAGYISFIPDSTGLHVVKRKWFQEDGFRRRESKWLGVDVGESFDEYLRTSAKVNARYLGTFRRTRFDISCESKRSGNVHAIMIDRCQIRDPPGPDLCQIEIEYLHSRTLRDEAAAAVEKELGYLVGEVSKVLSARRIPFRADSLSKMTYLRELRSGMTKDTT
jgi:hypothetical protein